MREKGALTPFSRLALNWSIPPGAPSSLVGTVSGASSSLVGTVSGAPSDLVGMVRRSFYSLVLFLFSSPDIYHAYL